MNRALLRWTIAMGCLVAAWFLSVNVPDDIRMLDPFPTTAALGEEALVDDVRVTVTDVVVSDGLSDGYSADPVEGTWVVVSATAEAEKSEVTDRLSYAALVIGGKTYSPSTRFSLQLDSAQLLVGIPLDGAVAFRIPSDAADSPATLRLAKDYSDQLLGAILEVPLDLGSASRATGLTIPGIVVGGG